MGFLSVKARRRVTPPSNGPRPAPCPPATPHPAVITAGGGWRPTGACESSSRTTCQHPGVACGRRRPHAVIDVHGRRCIRPGRRSRSPIACCTRLLVMTRPHCPPPSTPLARGGRQSIDRRRRPPPSTGHWRPLEGYTTGCRPPGMDCMAQPAHRNTACPFLSPCRQARRPLSNTRRRWRPTMPTPLQAIIAVTPVSPIGLIPKHPPRVACCSPVVGALRVGHISFTLGLGFRV